MPRSQSESTEPPVKGTFYLTGDAAKAWRAHVATMATPRAKDSTIASFLIAQGLGVKDKPRERRKAG